MRRGGPAARRSGSWSVFQRPDPDRLRRVSTGQRAHCAAPCCGAHRIVAAEEPAPGSPVAGGRGSMINDALLPSGSRALSAYRRMPRCGAARFMRPGTQRAALLVACELRFRYHARGAVEAGAFPREHRLPLLVRRAGAGVQHDGNHQQSRSQDRWDIALSRRPGRPARDRMPQYRESDNGCERAHKHGKGEKREATTSAMHHPMDTRQAQASACSRRRNLGSRRAVLGGQFVDKRRFRVSSARIV